MWLGLKLTAQHVSVCNRPTLYMHYHSNVIRLWSSLMLNKLLTRIITQNRKHKSEATMDILRLFISFIDAHIH